MSKRCKHPFWCRRTIITEGHPLRPPVRPETLPVVHNECGECGIWLPLGPASDNEATAVEAEAARLALHRIHDDWPDDEPDDEWANMGWAAYELGCEVYDGTWHGWLANHIVYEYEADQVIATHTSGTEEGVMTSDENPWVIEFRSGSYFRAPEDNRGSTLADARRFATMRDVDDFITENEWLLWNGGMPVEICASCSQPVAYRGQAHCAPKRSLRP